MRTAIDAAGRVVIPKALRDELGLDPGRELTLRVEGGALVLEPMPAEVSLVRRGKLLVAKPKEALPALSAEVVREALEGAQR